MGWTLITTLRLNDSDLQAGIDSLRQKYPQAIRRSLRRGAEAAETTMARAMVAETGLPVAKIKGALTITAGATSAEVKAKGIRIPLIDFKARGPEPSRGKGRGVSYAIAHGRNRDAHAFIATMPQGHRGVFKRTGRFGSRPSKRGGKPVLRESIGELFGPSLVNVFVKFLELGSARALEVFNSTLKHEIDRALSRR